jgi:hypothetical protein
MECLSDKRYPERLQCISTFIHSLVNNVPTAAPFEGKSLLPSDREAPRRTLSKKKRDRSNPTMSGLNNPRRSRVIG